VDIEKQWLAEIRRRLGLLVDYFIQTTWLVTIQESASVWEEVGIEFEP